MLDALSTFNGSIKINNETYWRLLTIRSRVNLLLPFVLILVWWRNKNRFSIPKCPLNRFNKHIGNFICSFLCWETLSPAHKGYIGFSFLALLFPLPFRSIAPFEMKIEFLEPFKRASRFFFESATYIYLSFWLEKNQAKWQISKTISSICLVLTPIYTRFFYFFKLHK